MFDKPFLKSNIFTKNFYLSFYQTTIVFVLFFYVVLKLASGHKFILSNEDKVYSLVMFLAFIICGLYKKRDEFGGVFNKVILYLFLTFASITFLMSLYFLYFTFTFNYGFDDGLIFILLIFFLLPILFTMCNFYLIKEVIKELIKS